MENHHKPSLLFHVSCLFVLTQLLSLVITQEFQVFGPSDPIVAAPGREAILPCSVIPAMNLENMEELRWYRNRFSAAVLVYRNQEEQKREQMPEYSWRTSLVKDQFHQGTAAVRIQNVQVSDSGIYICHFKQGVFYEEAILELKVAEEFLVFGPSDPIVAELGGEAILPCSVFPVMNVENMEELRWFRSRFSETVLVYRNQEEQKREQMPEYSRRTSLVKDQFHRGTAAVKIQNVQVSDSGIYVCYFKQGVFYEEAVLELKVAGMGSVPDVHIKGPEDGGVCVVCMTSGWSPEPQVHWRDSRGENLTAFSETHTTDAEGLFSTESLLVVRDSSVRNVTCSIFNPVLGQEKAMAIFLPEPFFPQVSPWKAAFFVTLTLMGLLVLGTSYLLRRELSARLIMQEITGTLQHVKDEKRKEYTLRTAGALMEELDRRKAAYMAAWRRAQLYADWRKEHFQAWTFTLDPDSAHHNLAISQDRLSVTLKDSTRCLEDLSSVLGIKGISSGRYYWEVKLTNIEGSKWILGVCRKGVDRKDLCFETPGKGFWTVGKSSGGYWAYIDSGRDQLSIREAPQIVGVFVDYTEGDISFYNMSDNSHMYSFPVASFSGTLFPYFRLRSGNVSMIINSMQCSSEGRVGEEERRGRKISRKGKKTKREKKLFCFL